MALTPEAHADLCARLGVLLIEYAPAGDKFRALDKLKAVTDGIPVGEPVEPPVDTTLADENAVLKQQLEAAASELTDVKSQLEAAEAKLVEPKTEPLAASANPPANQT